MDDERDEGLFDEEPELYEQEGPDLFGALPDELVLRHEPDAPADEVDIQADEMSEIPIDPDDVIENEPAVPTESQGDGASDSDDDTSPTDAVPAPAAVPASAGASAASAQGASRPEVPLALYRRYRPENFAQVIGQEHVTEPLQRALANNRVNHAYLFSGPRGCGKTSSARILARCLNCEQGPTPTPCGECQSCRDLARGGPGSIDVIEIDAASHGGVNEARDLRERAFFAPVHSRYKVYVIDEAHMVTKEGFNALLKVVEEPPPHVKFVFATTEPEKVLGTIRSRTHHYPFRLVPPRTLSAYLAEVCEREQVEVDAAVLPLVVRAGAGSVRDSLSVLDQLLGGATESGVSYAQATGLLGFTPDTLLDEIMDAFAAGDANGVFSCIDKVIEVGQDPRRFAEDLLRRLRDLIVVAAVPDALTSGLVDVAGDQAQRLSVQAAGLGAGELTRAAEVLAQGLTDMRGTTAPRLHLELMCARVLLPASDLDDRGVHARLDRLERRLNMPGHHVADQPQAPAQPAPRPRPEPERVSPDAGWPAPEAARPQPRDEPDSARRPVDRSEPARPQQAAEPPAVQQSARRPEPARQPEPSREPARAPAASGRPGGDPANLTVADIRHMWPQILEEVKNRRRFTWILLSQNAQVTGLANGVLTVSISNAGARDAFSRGGASDVLREAILAVVGAAPRIDVADGPAEHTGAIPTMPPPAPAPEQQRAAASEAVAAAAEAARRNIQPTEHTPPPPEEEPEPDPDDPELDDSGLDATQLLASKLGAELIGEEDTRA